MLRERLALDVRVDQKDAPAYDLVVAKNGPKLKESAPGTKESGGLSMRPENGAMLVTASGMRLKTFVLNMSFPAGRPIIDKTGLTGLYDIELRFTPERPLVAAGGVGAAPSAPDATPSAPSLADALDEQLGLKLVSSRGPMNVIVILHVERPSEN
jgi:uncharacterized protein (TIGR03435 family)